MDNTTEHQSQNLNIKTNSKSILVIGGAGYVGSTTAKELAKNGYTPVIIDRDIKSKPWTNKFGPAFGINLPQEIDLLDEVVKRYNIDSCIHFAAYTEVGESVKDPSKYYLNNVVMTLRLLDKLISLGIKKIVFSSSAAVYGIPKDGLALDSETNLNPINPYGQTKLIVEKILQDYWKAYGLRSVSLRYFNAAGADKDLETGEWREKESHIIPLAIKAAKQNYKFSLFGTDYDTKDGTCVRDYVHVTDLAQGHIKALQLIANEDVCERFNLGAGIPTSNMEIIKYVERYAGPIDLVKAERRPGDPATLVADISSATEKLNWQPTNSSVDNIVKTAVQWYNKMHQKEIN